MLTNNKVTIVRYVEEKDDYEPILACSAWIFCKKGLTGTVKGEESSDVLHIRIQRANASSIEKGDLVYVGEFKGQNALDLSECKKITRVTDNNYGSVPHWHIETEA